MRKMLSSFPDYLKSPPEYLLTMTELLASYPEHIQRGVCDVKTGVASKEEFLPSTKKVIEFAERLQAEEAKYSHYSQIKKGFSFKAIASNVPRGKYHCPFPKLEIALEAQGQTDLLINKNFDELWFASQACAVYGVQEAIIILRNQAGKAV